MSEIIIYTAQDGLAKVEVTYEGETFWLTQRRIAELFAVTVPTVSEHLTAIFESGELDRGSTVRKFRRVQTEGQRDLYEQASIDYDSNAKITKTFFATVQNKLHWAVTGKTAAEIIADRAIPAISAL